MCGMKIGYVLLAVLVALVGGFAIGALTSDGDKSDEDSALTTSTTSGEESRDNAQAPSDEEGSAGETETDQGRERAPESAGDERPPAPDDVIGDRPGAGGNQDEGQ